MKCIMGMVRPSARHASSPRSTAQKHDLVGTHHRGDRRPRHRAGAGRPAAVSQAHGRGEPAARRVPPDRARARSSRNLDFCFEMFPRLEGAPQPARRLDERRRAADAGAGARADERAAHPAGGRAVGRARADPGQPHHRRHQGAARNTINLTVLMAEQNFTQAIRIADRGYVIVHGKIAFEGKLGRRAQQQRPDPEVLSGDVGQRALRGSSQARRAPQGDGTNKNAARISRAALCRWTTERSLLLRLFVRIDQLAGLHAGGRQHVCVSMPRTGRRRCP